MANPCQCFCFEYLLVQSHEGSANLVESCKCGVASAPTDATASATAAVIATDADDNVDVANSINASEDCNYRTTASDN